MPAGAPDTSASALVGQRPPSPDAAETRVSDPTWREAPMLDVLFLYPRESEAAEIEDYLG